MNQFKEKSLLYVCYLTPEKDNYASFSDHEKIICIANSNKDVIETINKFNSDKQFKIIDKKDLNSFLYSFVNMKNDGYNN